MVRNFYGFYGAEMNLHLKQLSGTNNHHIIEAAFKAFAKALDGAVAAEPRLSGVLSTKEVFRMEDMPALSPEPASEDMEKIIE